MKRQPLGYGRHPTEVYANVYAALDSAKAGDLSHVATLVRFLEERPWSLGSGYLREDVARVVARVARTHPIDSTYLTRIQSVVLEAVVKGPARELRAFTRLARSVDTDELRDTLGKLAESTDGRIVRNARWVLAGLDPRLATAGTQRVTEGDRSPGGISPGSQRSG